MEHIELKYIKQYFPKVYIVHQYIHDTLNERYHQRLTEGYRIVFWHEPKINGWMPGASLKTITSNQDVAAVLKDNGESLEMVVNHILRKATSSQLERITCTLQHPLLILRENFGKFFEKTRGKVFISKTSPLTLNDLRRLDEMIEESPCLCKVVRENE